MNTRIRSFYPVIAAALALAPMAGSAEGRLPSHEDAPIALLVDLSSGQTLHARQENRRFLPASVTKVMTAYVAFEQIKAGKLSPRAVVTVRPEVAEEWSGTGSTMFLKPNQRVSITQLLHAITTISANDGCIALAEASAGSVEAWVALMNRTARELHMADSHFGTPNGYPDEGRTYTSAHDLALLADALITRHPDLYAEYFGKHGYSFNGITQENHDPVTGIVRGADGIKTGFTNEAGYNFLGSAARDGRRLVMVVAGSDSGAERARASRDYLEWGFSGFAGHPIFAKDTIVGSALVQNGASQRVSLRAPRAIGISLPQGERPQLRLTLHYRGPLVAPIAEGDLVAELEIGGDDIVPYRVPLAAAEAVDRANPLERIRNGLVRLVP